MKKNNLSRNDRKIVQNLSLAIKYFAQQQSNYFLHDLGSYHDVFFAELAEEALRKERAKYIGDLYSKKEKKGPCKILFALVGRFRKLIYLVKILQMKKIKEYGIVSQGVLIYRSSDILEVKKMVVEGNERYWEDYQKAINAGEKPADNQLFLVELDSDDEKN